MLPTPPACSQLLPDNWEQGVSAPDVRNDGATVGDWIAFADAVLGRLDTSNDRYRSAVGIIKRCETRDRAAVGVVAKRPTP